MKSRSLYAQGVLDFCMLQGLGLGPDFKLNKNTNRFWHTPKNTCQFHHTKKEFATENANKLDIRNASKLLIVFYIMIFTTFIKHKPKNYYALYGKFFFSSNTLAVRTPKIISKLLLKTFLIQFEQWFFSCIRIFNTSNTKKSWNKAWTSQNHAKSLGVLFSPRCHEQIEATLSSQCMVYC